MQRLEVSCAVRRIYTSLGAKWLTSAHYKEHVLEERYKELGFWSDTDNKFEVYS